MAFQIGWNFFNLPVALCARPVAAAQLPLLGRSFDRGDVAAFAQLYRAGLAFTVFLGLPASLLFFSIPATLADAVSFGGMASPDGVVLVAAAIGSLGLGIIGEALFIVSMSASYARRDAIMPLQAMAAARGDHICRHGGRVGSGRRDSCHLDAGPVGIRRQFVRRRDPSRQTKGCHVPAWWVLVPGSARPFRRVLRCGRVQHPGRRSVERSDASPATKSSEWLLQPAWRQAPFT